MFSCPKPPTTAVRGILGFLPSPSSMAGQADELPLTQFSGPSPAAPPQHLNHQRCDDAKNRHQRFAVAKNHEEEHVHRRVGGERQGEQAALARAHFRQGEAAEGEGGEQEVLGEPDSARRGFQRRPRPLARVRRRAPEEQCLARGEHGEVRRVFAYPLRGLAAEGLRGLLFALAAQRFPACAAPPACSLAPSCSPRTLV